VLCTAEQTPRQHGPDIKTAKSPNSN
jgi:hypothetical protein